MFQLNDVKMMPDEGGVSGASTSVSKDLADLNDESEAPIGEKEEEPDEDLDVEFKPEDEGPPDEEEEEEEEPAAELHPFERPSLKAIHEAYPDFFKKFPSMRDMYFREAEYSKLYPTIDDAKEAQENSSAFQNIREDVFNGTGEKFFGAVKAQNPRALQDFAGRLLGTLVKVDQDSFWRAANPLIEDVSRSMFRKGTADGNENLANAAKYLAHYFFGDADIAEGKKTTIPAEKPDSDVSRERKEWEDSKHNEFRGKVETSLRDALVDIITGTDPKNGKTKIDPDEVLSPFIRNTIIERVIADIGSTLAADKSHITYMDSLWSRAKQNGRTDNDKARLISAYLARARSLAPSLRSKYVSEALGKKVRGENQKRVKVASVQDRVPANGRASNGAGNKGYNPKTIDYRKTSDYDILNDDIKYKN